MHLYIILSFYAKFQGTLPNSFCKYLRFYMSTSGVANVFRLVQHQWIDMRVHVFADAVFTRHEQNTRHDSVLKNFCRRKNNVILWGSGMAIWKFLLLIGSFRSILRLKVNQCFWEFFYGLLPVVSCHQIVNTLAVVYNNARMIIFQRRQHGEFFIWWERSNFIKRFSDLIPSPGAKRRPRAEGPRARVLILTGV